MQSLFSINTLGVLAASALASGIAAAQTQSSSSSSSSSSCSSSSAPSSPLPALACSVSSAGSWAQGYQAAVDVTNVSDRAIDSWQVYLMLDSGHTIDHSWNVLLDRDHSDFTARNASWNGRLQPGESASFGLLGRHPGAFVMPQCSAMPEPNADFTVAEHGFTVQAKLAKEPQSNWQYRIDFGDGEVIYHHDAWHTYAEPGVYSIVVTARSGHHTVTREQQVSVQVVNADNRAPVARTYVDVPYGGSPNISDGLSYDLDGQALTRQWQTTRWINSSYSVLTVSDGALSDTAQTSNPVPCGGGYHSSVYANLNYEVDGRTVLFDAHESYGAELLLEYGDGVSTSRVVTSHTYDQPGEYEVRLRVFGGPYSDYLSQTIVIE
ncbi:cellulose binding domain-containing protein [Gilvimarinus sp. DA14]|uniref:cellulose binding domain-containing protein n=1 Tax=Gilvimarinus sp. DA14 TaxID=2956798 RepID=UPI0020B70BF1|nr:cellulose binding domain-containing protein [Gilvimarinus sp. DA14]UTF61804.1 cellulose binding domain-containing protein [Gilvimarinus sp. DA14]